MTPKPSNKRPTWADAVKALSDEADKMRNAPDYNDRERAVAFLRAVSWLNTVVPPVKRAKKRRSVSPQANGAGSSNP